MKILHIITSLRTGGAERLVVELALRHNKNQVEVLLFDGTRTPLMTMLEKSGVKVHALGKGSAAMSNPLLLPRLAKFLRKHPFDIVHTHNTPCQILSALVPGQTRITTEHNTLNRRRNWRWFRPIDRWLYGRYEKIVCVGEEARNTLSEWLDRPGLDKRMTVIPNGIDVDSFLNASADIELSSIKNFKILMVAAFRAQKDHACLIRALALLPDTYRLFLAGGAETQEDKKTLRSCQKLVQDLNLVNRVAFLGVRKDVPELLAACDVAVLSSHYEGFGLSAGEAMASGKVLIASDVESLTTLVGGAGLLFPQGDSATLASLIREVCENPEKAKEIGAKCQARARQYDIAETARRYLALYEEVVAAQNRH